MVLYVYSCMLPITSYFTLLVFGFLAIGLQSQFIFIYPVANDSGRQAMVQLLANLCDDMHDIPRQCPTAPTRQHHTCRLHPPSPQPAPHQHHGMPASSPSACANTTSIAGTLLPCRPANATSTNNATPTMLQHACHHSPTSTTQCHTHRLHHPSLQLMPCQHGGTPTISPSICIATTPKNCGTSTVTAATTAAAAAAFLATPPMPDQQRHHLNNASTQLLLLSCTHCRAGIAPLTTTPRKHHSMSASVALTAPTMPPREHRTNNDNISMPPSAKDRLVLRH